MHGRTYVLVRDITSSTKNKENGLLPRLRGIGVGQKSRTDDSDCVDARVIDVVCGLDATAGETGGHDAACVYVGVAACACGLGDPVDGCLHGLSGG